MKEKLDTIKLGYLAAYMLVITCILIPVEVVAGLVAKYHYEPLNNLLFGTMGGMAIGLLAAFFVYEFVTVDKASKK